MGRGEPGRCCRDFIDTTEQDRYYDLKEMQACAPSLPYAGLVCRRILAGSAAMCIASHNMGGAGRTGVGLSGVPIVNVVAAPPTHRPAGWQACRGRAVVHANCPHITFEGGPRYADHRRHVAGQRSSGSR